MKVLVADDSKLARLSVIKEFKNVFQGEVEFFEAENGRIAIEVFKKELPKIVFLDLTMPEKTGYEALEEMMKINSDASVVVISADVQPKSVQKVKELGAKTHVAKPISTEKMTEIFTIL